MYLLHCEVNGLNFGVIISSDLEGLLLTSIARETWQGKTVYFSSSQLKILMLIALTTLLCYMKEPLTICVDIKILKMKESLSSILLTLYALQHQSFFYSLYETMCWEKNKAACIGSMDQK